MMFEILLRQAARSGSHIERFAQLVIENFTYSAKHQLFRMASMIADANRKWLL